MKQRVPWIKTAIFGLLAAALGSLEQMLHGRFQRRDLRASLRPIPPAGLEVVFFRDYFQAGRCAVCCLVETHAARREVTTFGVEQ